MEWTKNIISPFNERAKSPLYRSFVVSWLICNWKILFAMFFFTEKNLGDLNIVEFILANYWSCLNLFLLPLLIALVYIYILPLMDFYIIRYSESQKRRKIDEKIRIAKAHYVMGYEYYDLKIKLEQEREKVLKFGVMENELSSQNHSLKNNYDNLNQSYTQLNIEAEKLTSDLQLLRRRHDLKFMEGRWELTFRFKDKADENNEHFELKNNNEYHIIEGTKSRLAFKIELFEFDSENRRVTFLKYNVSSPSNHCFAVLNVIDKNTLEGHENYDTKVIYKRQNYVSRNVVGNLV